MSRPTKRSLTLNGHRTSVSLEDEFWREFRRLVAGTGQPINAVAAKIDAERAPDIGLATAIRLFVLRELRAELARRSQGQ